MYSFVDIFAFYRERYKISNKSLKDNHGGSLLVVEFSNSPSALVASVYTDFEYLPWKFRVTPRGYFSDSGNIKKYLEWLLREVGVRGYKDLTAQHFRDHCGWRLLQQYGMSPQKVFRSSEGHFIANEMEEVEVKETEEADARAMISPHSAEYTLRNQWESKSYQLEFLEKFSQQKRFQLLDSEKWYSVTTPDIRGFGGAGLLSKYNGSLIEVLKAHFPLVDWLPWKFQRLPKGKWDDLDLLKKFVAFVEQKLDVVPRGNLGIELNANERRMQFWYRISRATLSDLGGDRIVKMNGGIVGVLQRVYPDLRWDPALFQASKSLKRAASPVANMQ